MRILYTSTGLTVVVQTPGLLIGNMAQCCRHKVSECFIYILHDHKGTTQHVPKVEVWSSGIRVSNAHHQRIQPTTSAWSLCFKQAKPGLSKNGNPKSSTPQSCRSILKVILALEGIFWIWIRYGDAFV